jgi:ankyrin repeat protein
MFVMQAARALLDAGADLFMRDQQNQSPLEVAQEKGHTACVALLEVS